VQRIVRAYDSYHRAEQMPLGIDATDIPLPGEMVRKRVLHPQ
jgi:hypothetical protein